MRKRKYTEEDVDSMIEAWQSTGNVWKAAELLSTTGRLQISGQYIHEAVRKYRPGVLLDEDKWSDEEIAGLIAIYTNPKTVARGDLKLKEYSKAIGRCHTNVSRKARSLGLTDKNRHLNEQMKEAASGRIKDWHREHPHPKGFMGKQHSQEAREKISASSKNAWKTVKAFIDGSAPLKGLKTKFERYGSLVVNSTGISTRSKSGIRDIYGIKIFLRSSWEANYARYLEFLKQAGEIKDWEYEPTVFWFDGIKRGNRSYTPDFRVWLIDKDIAEGTYPFRYVEIKGYMDADSRTKLNRFRSYYPDVELDIIGTKEYKQFESSFSGILPEWEHPRNTKAGRPHKKTIMEVPE